MVSATFSFALNGYAENPKKAQKTLPFPDIAATLQTLDRGLDAVTVSGGQIFTFADGQRHVVTTSVKPGAATSREARFGKITDSIRVPVYAEGMDTPTVRGAIVMGNRLLVMDGADLTLINIFKADMKEAMRRTTPLDLIKPPRDRGGEPPAFEIRDYRAKFKQRFLQTKRLPFVGLAPLPQSWQDGNDLLVLSRMRDFPLLALDCKTDDVSQCFVARGCFATFGQDFSAEKVRGVATYEPKRWVLVGDPENHKIRVLKFSSCFQVKEMGSLHLPPKIKSLRNLWIDEQQNLWLATAEPDWTSNASLYFWTEKDWLAAFD